MGQICSKQDGDGNMVLDKCEHPNKYPKSKQKKKRTLRNEQMKLDDSMSFSENGMASGISGQTYQQPGVTLENDYITDQESCIMFCGPRSSKSNNLANSTFDSKSTGGISLQSSQNYMRDDLWYSEFDENLFENPFRQRMNYLLALKLN